MQIRLAVVLVCVPLLGLFAYNYRHLFAERPDPGTPEYLLSHRVKYSFTLSNRTNRLISDADLWVYAPYPQTAFQRCGSIETSHPRKSITDTRGNHILYFGISEISPFSKRIVSIEAKMGLSRQSNRLPLEAMAVDLTPQLFCESDDPQIVAIAGDLKAVDKLQSADSIFKWVVGHIRYDGYHRQARGARYALRQKKGDCTEFMYLFVALCRAADIPARCLGGYILPERTVLRPGQYHNWAEFFAEGRWHIADPQRKRFCPDGSGYLAMNLIHSRRDGVETPDSVSNPMGRYNRFRYRGEGLKVKMNG